jgi:hypothetical protein
LPGTAGGDTTFDLLTAKGGGSIQNRYDIVDLIHGMRFAGASGAIGPGGSTIFAVGGAYGVGFATPTAGVFGGGGGGGATGGGTHGGGGGASFGSGGHGSDSGFSNLSGANGGAGLLRIEY